MTSRTADPQLKTHNSKLITLFIPIAIFLFALALRLWGIGWSLPYVVHPDEPVVVDTAISMIKRGSLDPNFFEYPSLFIYWQYALTNIWLLWQGLTHSGVTAANLPNSSHIYTLTPNLYIWGRTAAAVLGAGGVVVMYWLGRRLFNLRVGLIAALLLAVSPFHSENSHYIEVDVMMWTLACITALLAYEVMARGAGHRWLAFAAGLLGGLTTGAKYTGLAMLVMVGIGWLFSIRPRLFKHIGDRQFSLHTAVHYYGNRLDHPRDSVEQGAEPVPEVEAPLLNELGLYKLHQYSIIIADAAIRLALILLGTAVGFIASTPYFILNNTRFWQSYGKQANSYKPVGNFDEYWNTVSGYIDKLWTGEWFIIVPGVIGVGYLLLRDWRKGLLLGPFPFLYLLAVSYLGQTYPRNGYLSVVMLVLPAAYLLDALVGWLAYQVESRKLKVESRAHVNAPLRPASSPLYFSISTFIVLALLLFLPLRQTVNWDSYLSQRDGAFLAQDWMEQQRPLGKRFVVELHPWQFLGWPDVIAIYIQGSNQPPITIQPPAYYANLGYDYAMLSSVDDKQRTYNPNDHLKEYQALPKVISFPGDHTGGKGPDLTVYQLGRGFAQRQIQTHIEASFGSLATLRGYEFGLVADSRKMFVYNPQAHPAIERGKLLGVNLYFQAAQPDGRDWTLFLHLNAPGGSTVSQIDVPTRYGATIPHPTSQWHAGEYIIGGYSLPLAASAPPGSYTLELGLYDPASGARLPISGNGLTVKDNALIISGIEVK